MNAIPAAQVATSTNARARLARYDSSQFNSYVLRDEQSGDPVVQAPIHRAWHNALRDNIAKRTLIWSHVESGKTTQLSVGRTLWKLGKNPNLRVAIVSNTEMQAKKPLSSIKQYIEKSEQLPEVFPNLRPGAVWNENAITVERKVVSKDPSIQAFGVHGAVLGARIDLLVLDDILDFENTLTPESREKLWRWIQATLLGRLTINAEVLVVGTAWHPDDAMHRFAKLPNYKALRYPVIDDEPNSPTYKQTRWPEKFPMARIEAKRLELGPLEFARQLLCVARDDSTARFKREWIERCVKRGEFKIMAPSLPGGLPPGFKAYTGVDLGVQEHAAADMTVLFTIAVHPNQDRELLWIEAGRWSGPEIVSRIIDVNRRYGSIVRVENNAAQDFILQFARGSSAVPVQPHTTGRSKAHPEFGVEALATEMSNGKWIIPSKGGLHPEVQAWVDEMLYYSPDAHTGDRLMASWFAVEAVRAGLPKVETGKVNWQRR